MVSMIATSLLLAALLQPAAGDPLAARLQAQANVYEMRRPSPGIHFSPRAAAAYAMSSGCVPAVATGRPATEFFQTAASGRGRDREGVHSVSVTVALTEDTHGCTVLAKAGEPEELREAVLRALDDEGAVRTVVSDSGAGSRDSSGAFRQELHCLTLNGRAMFLVMSTSSASNRPRLMASLGADAAGDCGRRSAG
jgi:hypothetical protein